MKKKNIFLGAMFLILLSLFIKYEIDSTYAATIDNNPPKLISFNIDNSNATPGKYLYLNINAEDDISGLGSGSIGLHSPIKGYTVYQFDIENLNNPRILISKGAVGGEYLISHLMLRDKKGNMVTYYNKNIFPNDENTFDFGDNVVKIISDSNFGDDDKAPIVSNVTVDKQKISLGDEVKVCAKVTDDSKIKYINVKLALKKGFTKSDSKNMVYDSTSDSYCAILKPTKTGTHIVSEIYAIDAYDNGTGYYSKEITDTLEIIEMPEIEVDGPENDIESPTLVSIKLNKQSLIAPGSVKVFIEANDNSGEIPTVYARFISEEEYNKNNKAGTYSDGEIVVNLRYDEIIGKYVGTFDLNQYAVSGKYFLQKIIMTDSNNNSSQYVSSHYPENMFGGYSGTLRKREKIDDLYFEVKEEFAYDAVTSTINNNMLEIIKNQNDNAVIMIDATNDYIIPASVFEAIQGTNKTIYIESNGYQWVFNGKDINNIKSIDSQVYSELLVDQNIDNKSQEYIAIVFANNGVLPGKAKIRVKTDYTFRYIEGYENLKLYFYNPSEEKYKELDNEITLTEDGFYEFEITHNSKYVLSNKGINKELLTNNEEINDNNINENKVNNFVKTNYIYILIVAGVILIVSIVIILIKKHKKLNN